MTDFIFYEAEIAANGDPTPVERQSYSLDTVARHAEIHPDLVLHYCRLGLLGDKRMALEPETVFDDDSVFELRRIEYYRRHLGVNRAALPLLISLLHEVERLQEELRFHRPS